MESSHRLGQFGAGCSGLLTNSIYNVLFIFLFVKFSIEMPKFQKYLWTCWPVYLILRLISWASWLNMCILCQIDAQSILCLDWHTSVRDSVCLSPCPKTTAMLMRKVHSWFGFVAKWLTSWLRSTKLTNVGSS